ncbi:hypothetical protein [Stutzerimonas stutzeri]|uniref:hypothetical protein n=1 Tax=Stutzerimonas stutzeri TaxID=316 RepID=UPI0005EBD76A|nr:hypothetical protein [Stutzerimonas stutzeri]
MEILLVIAVVAAFVLLVKHTKAKGRISELTSNLKARQNEIEDLEREMGRLRTDLQVQLQELQRFKPIQDVEAEATRLRIEAEARSGARRAHRRCGGGSDGRLTKRTLTQSPSPLEQ